MPRGTPSITTLQAHGTDLLRSYTEADAKRTQILRDLAKCVVGIRAQTMTGDGKTPDWAGQSQAYRDVIRAMYDDAGIPVDSASNVQAALRYHIGEVLREVVSPGALTKAGLATKGPKDRARTRNGEQATTAALSPSTAEAPTDPEEAMRAAILFVQHAHATPAPKDPSVLLILCLSLEHACQVLREQIQSQAERAALSPESGSVRNPAPAKRTRKALAKAA